MSEILGTVRASSWARLFDCPLSWYYSNVMGLRMAQGVPACMGTAIHHGTAAYDAARLAGEPMLVDDAVDMTLEKIRRPEEDTDWRDDELSQQEATRFAVLLTTRYCLDVAPRQTYVAIELRCEALDISTPYGVVRVTGTTDRVRLDEEGRRGITDLKSGKRATEQLPNGRRRAVTAGHGPQLGIYTLMGEQATGLPFDAPGEIVGLQVSSEAPVARGEIADVKTPLLGTEEQPGLIVMAAKMLKEGFFPPNPKSFICSKKYCAGWSRCLYRDR